MSNRREPGIFEDNPFIEDFLEWKVSPGGQLAGEVSDLVSATLEHASVDAGRRKIIWPDGKRLSREQSVQRIRAEYPDLPSDLIDTHLCSWLENCVPEDFTESQLEELDRLVEPWLLTHERRSRAARK